MDEIFVDTDVILDLLTARKPFYDAAAILFSLADKSQISLYVSALTFANLNYILSRQYSPADARQKLLHFKNLVSVLPVTDKIVSLSLTSSDFKDFEDGMQYFTAIENDIHIILTRNLPDYKTSAVSVLTPDQYVRGR